MGRNKGSKNHQNKTADKIKQVEEALEVVNIDTIIENENKELIINQDKNIKSDTEEVTEVSVLKKDKSDVVKQNCLTIDNKEVLSAQNCVQTDTKEIKPEVKKPKTRFDDERYLIFAKEVHRIYCNKDNFNDFEIKLRWFMIKCNIYIELMTRYWLDRFLQEYVYMSTPIIKQMLKNENLL